MAPESTKYELEKRILDLEKRLDEYKNKNKTLYENQERYRDLYEKAPLAYHSLDEEGCLVEVNQTWLDTFGFSRDEVIGKSVAKFLHPDWVEHLKKNFTRFKENGEILGVEFVFIKKDGSEVNISVDGKLGYDDKGNFKQTHCILKNITEQKHLESERDGAYQALIENEERFRTSIESSNDGFAFSKKGRLVYVNKRFMEMFGYENFDELNDQHISILIHPGDRNRVLDRYSARERGENVAERYEFKGIRKDGTPVVIDISSTQTRYQGESVNVAFLRDASDRIAAAEQQQLNKDTLSSFFKAAPIGIGLVHNRVFSWVSWRITEITGYSQEELIGQSARMLYPSDEEFKRVGDIKYGQLKHADVGEVDTVWRTKNGELIDIHLRSAPIDSADFSKGVTFTALDISERKRAEKEKEKLESQILHVQKLESLGVLAGGIAHDFNNLLMAILGNADLALLELSPVAPARENIIEIEKASRRAADLCKQMLAYSGKGKFLVQAIDLTELVGEITHMLEVSISKKAVLRYNFGDNLPAFEGDPTQIRQIIMNLVINASEAIGDRSGVISVSTGAMDCDKDYLTSTYLDEDLQGGLYVYIEVADTGCGMDEEVLLKLFDPFFTTKFTGRGLGMSAILGIVRGHHGCIKIYTEKGRGTNIKVLFPANEGAVVEGEASPVGKDEEWHGKGTILLVDDEDTVRAVGKKMLRALGFTVITAVDGREAVALFTQRSKEIDCVLLDLTMPHMDGEQAFREMRRIQPDVRVILSSGYNEQDISERFAGKGLKGIIQKPYSMAPLRDILHNTFENDK